MKSFFSAIILLFVFTGLSFSENEEIQTCIYSITDEGIVYGQNMGEKYFCIFLKGSEGAFAIQKTETF